MNGESSIAAPQEGWVVELVLCILVLAIATWALVLSQWNRLESAREQEPLLRIDFEHAQRTLASHEPLKHRLAQLTEMLGPLSARLPDQVPEHMLRESLNAAAQSSDVFITGIELDDETKKGFYAIRPFQLQARGGYRELTRFALALLTEVKPILRGGDFVLARRDDGDGLELRMRFEVFRYLSDAEFETPKSAGGGS